MRPTIASLLLARRMGLFVQTKAVSKGKLNSLHPNLLHHALFATSAGRYDAPNGTTTATTAAAAATAPVAAHTLPQQPVPSLQSTLLHFANFNQAFVRNRGEVLTGEQLARVEEVEKLCLEMSESEAVRRAQELLEQRAKSQPNWLTPWWVNVAYLEGRTPLPIVTSPGVELPRVYPIHCRGKYFQTQIAADFIQIVLKYFRTVISGKLPVDRAGRDPLDMSQYYNLFGTTRVPRRQRDELRYGRDRPWAHHIIVTHNGYSYQLPVVNSTDGQPLSRLRLRQLIWHIIHDSPAANPHPINVCSSDNRNAWADVYARLEKNSPAEVESVERALFVLALDNRVPKTATASVVGSAAAASIDERTLCLWQALHGGGTHQNTNNRWFDKTLQFFINDECYCGMTYEHTPAEGPPLANLLDYIVDAFRHADDYDPSDAFVDQPPSDDDLRALKRLDFTLTDADRRAIVASAEQINRAVADLDVRIMEFSHYGKNVPKAGGVSPDSYVQLAMQWAYYNLHRRHAPTYETGTLRRFRDGRTETIRLPNDASRAFVERAAAARRMRDLLDVDVRRRLLAAVRAHKQYSAEAMMGRGMDRHLLGLRLIMQEQGMELPALYRSSVYAEMMHYRLSTSQVPTKNQCALGFGPSASDCYGVCYNPQERKMTFAISAYASGGLSVDSFAEELEEVLLKMREIVTYNSDMPVDVEDEYAVLSKL